MEAAIPCTHSDTRINVTGVGVDNNYGGEIKVLLHNSTDQPFVIKAQHRIAEFLFEICSTPCMIISQHLASERISAVKFVTTKHIDRKINITDLFTKEDKDTAQFVIY